LGLEGLVELLVAQEEFLEQIHLLLVAHLEHLFFAVAAGVVGTELLPAIQRELLRDFRRELLDFLEQQERQGEQQALVDRVTLGQVQAVLEAEHLQRQHLQEGRVEITAYRGCLQQHRGHWVVARAAQLHQLTSHPSL
jgi:hypothetical protein